MKKLSLLIICIIIFAGCSLKGNMGGEVTVLSQWNQPADTENEKK